MRHDAGMRPDRLDNLNTFQRSLRALVDASGLSVNAWAKRYGLVQSSVDRMVKGGLDPRTSTVEQIAERIGVHPWQLFYTEQAASPARSSGLSAQAVALAQALDRMPDEARKARAYAVALQLIQFENEPAPAARIEPAPQASKREPQPALAPKPKPRSRQ